jgi:hypothetical protein
MIAEQATVIRFFFIIFLAQHIYNLENHHISVPKYTHKGENTYLCVSCGLLFADLLFLSKSVGCNQPPATARWVLMFGGTHPAGQYKKRGAHNS